MEDTLEKSGINVPDTTFFVHGSTIIINALTKRKGVKTGLITTKGFRDVLAITRANRPDIYNMYYTKPEPFVPRYLRLEVRERVNYKGEELDPLNEDDVRQVAAFFKKEGADEKHPIEAIAVCFLHSYANPDHEARCGELLRDLLPDIPVTLSHEITKEWREYERTNTTVLNAYVQPIAVHYLDTLEKDLNEMGMGSVEHIMQSNGGIATFEMARQAPIKTCESGPVAADRSGRASSARRSSAICWTSPTSSRWTSAAPRSRARWSRTAYPGSPPITGSSTGAIGKATPSRCLRWTRITNIRSWRSALAAAPSPG